MPVKKRISRTKHASKTRKPIATPTEPTVPEGETLSVASVVIAKIRPSFPALTDADREAYRTRTDDETCDRLGGKTKSANVISVFARWIKIIAATLHTQPTAVAGYGPHRFAYLLEVGSELLHRMDEQRQKESGRWHAATTTNHRRETALATRENLLTKLSTIAGSHHVDRADLDEATGTIADDDALGTSLESLADLATRWIKSAPHAPLVRDAALSEVDVEHAINAATELAARSAAQFNEGRRIGRDSPEVNRAEGRVIAELRVPYDVFRKAHRANHVVPLLPLQPGIQRVFASHARSSASTAVEPPAKTGTATTKTETSAE